jgi:Conserved region in glutamate synthase
LSIDFPSIDIFVQRILCGSIVRYSDGVQDLQEQASSINIDPALQGEKPTNYVRYKIEAKPAPPRRKQAHPFYPRVDKVGLANSLLREVLGYGFKLRRKEYRAALMTRPCIYGVFAGRFGGFHPIREKCTGCMRCVQEYPNFCKVDRNPEFYKFADSYWIPEDPATASGSPVATVSNEAETGKIPIKGMGYKGAFAGPGWDSMWTDMSEIVRPTRDGVYGREYISTIVDVGRKQCFLDFFNQKPTHSTSTVEIALPIIFDYLPPNLNNPSILRSIAGAAAKTGTLFIAHPNQVQQLPHPQLQRSIPMIEPANTNQNVGSMLAARAIELTKYEPGAFDRIRATHPKAPISVRVPLSNYSDEETLDLVQAGVDIIHLYADYHGRGWDRENQKFVGDLIRSAHGKLVKESLRDDVTIIVSGGITLAEHVPKAIICGADLVAIDTTVLVALQAQFLSECNSPETGRIAPENFDTKWGEQRLTNLLVSWHDQLIEILSAMGMRDVRRLRGDMGRAMFNDDLEKEAFADITHGT